MEKQTTTLTAPPASAFTGTLRDVSLSDILPDSSNKLFRDDADMSEAALKELSDSIASKGVIQPVLLRPDPGNKGKFIIVAGERRFSASCYVMNVFKTRTTIPSYIKDISAAEALELQIIENLQRENVNPMREAHGFERLVKERKFTTATIAAKIGKSIDYVQERIRLMQLSKKGQQLVRDGVLPLKAALLIVRAPANLQDKAIDRCVDTLETEKGKTTVFMGLQELRDFLDYEVFNDLDKVAFNPEDAKLVASAGTCSACTKRTHNTGGLFDDISKGDRCLDGGCFRAKLTAHYKNLQEEVKKKHPQAEVIFKARNYSNTNGALKLGPIQNSHEGWEISEAQAKNDKTAKLAILVGDGGTKKTQWISSTRPGEKKEKAKPTVKSPAQKAAEVREKEKEAKQGVMNAFQDYYQVAALFKRSPLQLRELLRRAITEYAEGNGDADESLSVLFAYLDVPFELKANYMANAKVVKIEGTVQQRMELLATGNGSGCIKDTEKLTDKIPVDNLLHAFAWICLCQTYNSSDSMRAAGLDKKAITKKAQEATDTWWKEKQKAARALEAYKAKPFPSSGGLKGLLKPAAAGKKKGAK